jgi:hypothetical protein
MTQAARSTTATGAVWKIIGSVVIGKGTTTMVTDIRLLVPVVTQATNANISMESGLFSEDESVTTKHMFYEADHSANELDTIDGENKFMNLSMISNMMNDQIRMDCPKD